MSSRRASSGGEAGQAAVELVALLPLLAVLVALMWQAVVAGQAVWLAGSAARAAARAAALGGDPASAARSVLPGALDGGLRVDDQGDGRVDVGIAVPAIVGDLRLATVHARARFAPQGS